MIAMDECGEIDEDWKETMNEGERLFPKFRIGQRVTIDRNKLATVIFSEYDEGEDTFIYDVRTPRGSIETRTQEEIHAWGTHAHVKDRKENKK